MEALKENTGQRSKKELPVSKPVRSGKGRNLESGWCLENQGREWEDGLVWAAAWLLKELNLLSSR